MARLKYTPKQFERKTTEEIESELIRLSAIKKKLPHYDKWRTNNWHLVDAQVKVLKERLGMDEIVQKWNVEDDAQGAAEDTRFWMDGGDVLSPYDRWCL